MKKFKTVFGKSLFYGFSLCSLLSGCKVGPNYNPPENTVSNEWAGAPKLPEVALSEQDPLIQWWKVFDDPLLTKYIEMAAVHNNDVLTAEANILQARALRQVAASSLFPQLTANLNATKTYFSKNGPVFAIGTAGQPSTGAVSTATGLPFSVQVPQIQNLYNALFDASWEIDLFGKTRRTVEAADATIDTMMEQKNDTLLSVMAEIARNYMELRSTQRQAELVKQNIELLETNLFIVKKSLECGLDNALNLQQIEAELATAKSNLPPLISEIYRGIYTLSILTGNVPESLVDELLEDKPLPKAPREIAVGIRSDLLRRRPDVRKAERQLAVATANIGVAVASFYPSLVLTADGGFQSLKVANLFQLGSKTWDYGGNIAIPIFQGGQLIGNLHANKAVASAVTHTYQQTVLKALQDAESAIIAYAQDLSASDQLLCNTENNQNLVELSEHRYILGLTPLTDLITTKRQLITSEENLLQSELSSLLDLITLYKALGGGWQPVLNP